MSFRFVSVLCFTLLMVFNMSDLYAGKNKRKKEEREEHTSRTTLPLSTPDQTNRATSAASPVTATPLPEEVQGVSGVVESLQEFAQEAGPLGFVPIQSDTLLSICSALRGLQAGIQRIEKKHLEQLSQETGKLQKELNRTDKLWRDTLGLLKNLKVEYKALEKEKTELEKKQQEDNAALETMRQENASLNKEIQSLSHDLEKIRKELALMREQGQSLEENCQMTEERVYELEEKMKEKEVLIRKLQSEKKRVEENLSKRLKQMHERYQFTRHMCKEQQTRTQSLERDRAQLLAELDEHQNLIASLNAKIKELQVIYEQNAFLKGQALHLREEIQRLTQSEMHHVQLTQELSEAQAACQALTENPEWQQGYRSAVQELAGPDMFIAPNQKAAAVQLQREVDFRASQKERIATLEGENIRLRQQLEEALSKLQGQEVNK